MKLELYKSTEVFGNDVMEILLRQEVQNNLPIGLIRNERGVDTTDWFMAAVKDDSGAVVLTALCTPPFNVLLVETDQMPNQAAVDFLSREIRGMNLIFPGVTAERGLAACFAGVHVGENMYYTVHSLIAMRLDKFADFSQAPGYARPLCAEDMYFAPYWMHGFVVDCGLETYDIPTYVESLGKKVGKDDHYFWVDKFPVAQAAFARSTVNGAVLGAVYTPPHFRGKGYGTAIVAELARKGFERGHKFCCLFADAKNPVSCGMYQKIGFVNQGTLDELRFNEPR